jgi:hypothetical protein
MQVTRTHDKGGTPSTILRRRLRSSLKLSVNLVLQDWRAGIKDHGGVWSLKSRLGTISNRRER